MRREPSNGGGGRWWSLGPAIPDLSVAVSCHRVTSDDQPGLALRRTHFWVSVLLGVLCHFLAHASWLFPLLLYSIHSIVRLQLDDQPRSSAASELLSESDSCY